MNRNLDVIILAAGQGTRMKSATIKILHAAAGRPIIDYVLDLASAVDCLQRNTLDSPAVAIVFDDGLTRAAIVTTDLIGLEQATVAAHESDRQSPAHLHEVALGELRRGRRCQGVTIVPMPASVKSSTARSRFGHAVRHSAAYFAARPSERYSCAS